MSIERFDTYDSVDLADSSYVSPDCPSGVSLAPGETVLRPCAGALMKPIM